MDGGTVLAGLAGVIITAIATIATQRAAAKAAVHAATRTSRDDLEREAFERAKGYYTDTIDRQAGEIHELEADVLRLKGKVAELEREVRGLTAELATAKNALRLKFPDE